MTNKVLCVEKVEKLFESMTTLPGGAYAHQNTINKIRRSIARGELTPSPAPAEGLLPCKLCGCVPNTEPLHDNGDQSGPQAVVCSNELCLLGNMAVAPEAWNKAMSLPTPTTNTREGM